MERPPIPVVNLGAGGFDQLVEAHRDRLDEILLSARRRYTAPVLWLGDRLARRWAVRGDLAYREEYLRVAEAVGRSGAWLLNFSYEFGCTSAAVAEPSGAPRLLRAMDWEMPSLGRTLLAVRCEGPAGPWVNLAWPGFVGVVQALAPGRFAAAINQAPSPDSGFGAFGDWVAGKADIWRNGLMPPALLLRAVFDTCATFEEARARLIHTPICASAFLMLVGVRPGETVLIERTPRGAVVHDGPVAISNHWLTAGLPGISRSHDTLQRLEAMRAHQATRAPAAERFCWLEFPILNPTTRLVMEAVPATGELVVQGHEADGPATAVLDLAA